MRIKRITVIVLCASMLGSGCVLKRKPLPAPAGAYKKQITDDLTSTDWLVKYNAMPSASAEEKKTKAARRNQILNGFVWLIDDYYYQYERKFYHGRATFSAGSAMINLGLTSAAAVTGGEQLKTILATVATGVTGATTAIDKNFFDEQSRGAVAAKMRALREATLVQIVEGTKQKLDDYPLELGLAHIQEYFYAGTLVGALQGIHIDASKQSIKAKEDLDKAQKKSAPTY